MSDELERVKAERDRLRDELTYIKRAFLTTVDEYNMVLRNILKYSSNKNVQLDLFVGNDEPTSTKGEIQ